MNEANFNILPSQYQLCSLYIMLRIDISAGVNTSIKDTHLPLVPAYMRRWTWSLLVQVMACRLFGAKLLPEPRLTYCQLDS